MESILDLCQGLIIDSTYIFLFCIERDIQISLEAII